MLLNKLLSLFKEKNYKKEGKITLLIEKGASIVWMQRKILLTI